MKARQRPPVAGVIITAAKEDVGRRRPYKEVAGKLLNKGSHGNSEICCFLFRYCTYMNLKKEKKKPGTEKSEIYTSHLSRDCQCFHSGAVL